MTDDDLQRDAALVGQIRGPDVLVVCSRQWTLLHSHICTPQRPVNRLTNMMHIVDVHLRLHIDDTEIEPGEWPRDAAARLLREIMTVDDEVLSIVPVMVT
jgi:hypothetical protein